MPDIILLGGHHDPRTTLFQAALNNAGLAPAKVISYPEIAASPSALQALCSPDKPTLLRVESSGSDLDALQVILEKGAEALQEKGADVLNEASSRYFWSKSQITQALAQRGQLVPSNQYYAGLSAIYKALERQTSDALPNLSYMNPLEDSLLMSDKAACHAFLKAHDIPVAVALTSPQNPIRNYADLRQRMQQQKMSRVFVKLRHGAGAAGIVALEASTNRVQARTTVESVDTADGMVLFNSTQIRRTNNETDIKALIDQLCQMDVHVESWIPKAQVDGNSVDMRILVIGGQVCHQVLRMSRSPITNLHLLNQRSEVTPLKQKMSDEAWQALESTCLKVAGLFPKCTYVALDVLVDISLKRHVVLEVNAFGDFVKNVWHDGMSPYEREIQVLQQRWATQNK